MASADLPGRRSVAPRDDSFAGDPAAYRLRPLVAAAGCIELITARMQLRMLANVLVAGSRAGRLKAWGVALLALAGMLAIYGLTSHGLTRMTAFTPLARLVADKVLEYLIMVLLASMTLSATLNSLSALYLSADLPWLAVRPLPWRALYYTKLLEVYGLSAWMVLAFGAPVFVAYGVFFGAAPAYYLVAVAALVALALIPSALGMALVSLLVNLLPARRFRDVLVFATVATLFLVFIAARGLQLERLSDPQAAERFAGALVGLQLSWATYLPSSWMAEALRPLLRGQALDWRPLLVLGAAALATAVLGQWLVELLFARGLSRALGSQPPLAARTRLWRALLGLYLWPWPRRLAALARKDLLTLLRDSTQWSQIMVLGAVVVIYVVNVQAFPVDQMVLFGLQQEQARDLLGYLNISLTGLVMAAVGARFLFTGISLEGQAVWLLRSAPLRARDVLAAKLAVGLPPCLAIGLALDALTNWILRASPQVWLAGWLITPVLGLGIGGLGVGLGALLPNFRAANPAKIVAGLGGMAYMLAAVAYVVLGTAIVAYPLLAAWRTGSAPWGLALPAYLGLWLATGLAAGLALWAGGRRWERTGLGS